MLYGFVENKGRPNIYIKILLVISAPDIERNEHNNMLPNSALLINNFECSLHTLYVLIYMSVHFGQRQKQMYGAFVKFGFLKICPSLGRRYFYASKKARTFSAHWSGKNPKFGVVCSPVKMVHVVGIDNERLLERILMIVGAV